MSLDQDFIEAVEDKNKRLVRIKLANSITIDPTLRTFEEMKKYAETHISDLFDVHKGDLLTDRGEWTKDYYDKQQTELSFNFSRERLRFVCEMAVYLYSERIKTVNNKRMENREPMDILGDLLIVIGKIFENIGKNIEAFGNNIRN
jgi:hypothetical protein